MKLAGLIRERDVWRAGTLLVMCVLVATLASLIAATELMPDMREIIRDGVDIRLDGDEAAAKGWPSGTPHATPWLPPANWNERGRTGVRQYAVYALDPAHPDQIAFDMQVTRAGWPWPVLERKTMRWDRNNAALSGADQDPPTSLLYGRLALDALVLGVILWVLILGMLAAWAAVRRRGHASSAMRSAPSRIPPKLFKRGEIGIACSALVLFLLLAGIGALIVGWKLLPKQSSSVVGASMQITGAAAAARGWPSSTPHEKPWPSPTSLNVTRAIGVRHFNVFGANPTSISGNGYQMTVYQAGWPLPVLERKQMWWDWDDPAMKGPVSDPAPSILYGRLGFSTLILGGGLWLLVFVPLGLWVIGRRVSWTLGGRCTFCGYDMTGMERCSECGWQRGAERR